MEVSIAVVVMATAAAIILSLVVSRQVGFIAFVAGCAVALVWAAMVGGKSAVESTFGTCFSAGVVWGALEMLVIDNFRQTPKKS